MAIAVRANGAAAEVGSAMRELSAVEVGVIDLFVRLVQTLGIAKSLGEIYGLLFVSAEPLPMDEIISLLNISKGSVSQGLKQLKAFGAVRTVYRIGDRRDHWEAELKLKKLVGGFLREQLQPRVTDGAGRVKYLEAMLNELPAEKRKALAARISILKTWHSKIQKGLPFALKVLDAT